MKTNQYSHWMNAALRTVAPARVAARPKLSHSDAKVLKHVDACMSAGSAAGLGGYERKLLKNAVAKLTTNGTLVYVGHATLGKGWIRAMGLPGYALRGWKQETPAV